MKYSFTSASNDPLIAAVSSVLNPITEGIVDFVGASKEDIEAIIKQLKADGHSPEWEDTTRLSSKNSTTVSAMKKILKTRTKKESVELDEAKAADPANLKSIITNHSALLKKATEPEAKKFHQTAIANAKEKLRALGEEVELDEASDASILNSLGFKNTTRDIAGLAARLDPNSVLGKSIATNLGSGYRNDFVKMQKCMQTIEDTWDDITKDLSMSSQDD